MIICRKNIDESCNLTLLFICLVGIYLTSFYSYLLFHTVTEIFCVIIGCAIFIITWNTRNILKNNYLKLIGIAYLFVGIIDLIHTLSFKGMIIFQGYGANLPTQLWILARFMESFSLLIAPLFFRIRVKSEYLFITYFLFTSIFLFLIFSKIVFPDCYIEGVGLTLFKKISEYIISTILIASLIFLYRDKDRLNPRNLRLISLSILFTIFSELAFTFYIDVFGVNNLIGHIFKILSFYLIYRAIIVSGLSEPYQLLFRELKKERDELKSAMDEIKTLNGLLPICSSCKQIRDDQGYWNKLETYIQDHTEAEFSHGICPKCSEKLYGQEKWYEKFKKECIDK